MNDWQFRECAFKSKGQFALAGICAVIVIPAALLGAPPWIVGFFFGFGIASFVQAWKNSRAWHQERKRRITG